VHLLKLGVFHITLPEFTMHKNLLLILVCLFIVMIGFGITLPVLPFYAERLHITGSTNRQIMAIHISLLTSIYALMQLIFAPFWGSWSDRVGRRPLVLLGLAGAAITQVLFGIVNSLWMLYAVRAIGGLLTSAMLPVATAYVADITTERDRNQGMAWLGTAVSLGVVAGPTLGGLATRRELHFAISYQHFRIDGFSLPFFTAAVLAGIALLIALRWLPESLHPQLAPASRRPQLTSAQGLSNRPLRRLLALTIAGQFGLAIFEATFALYAQETLKYGPVEIGIAFMVCGLVMSVFQVIAVSYLSKYISAIFQVALGFSWMGIGITLLLITRTMPLVLGAIGLLSFGMALVSPNLTALIADQGGVHQGAVLGLQNSASSLGQVGGPLFGGVLFGWQAESPYLIAGVFLLGLGLAVGWQEKSRRRLSN
jgi:DHA1 family multidrug resistance protein-like MFS transporter